MTEIERKALALANEEAIAWANKVVKAKGTSYTPASRNAAAFILASCDRIEALEAEVERLRSDKIVLSMDGSAEDVAASAIEAGEWKQ